MHAAPVPRTHGATCRSAHAGAGLHGAESRCSVYARLLLHACYNPVRLQGNVFVNQYLVIKELGRGAHGSVKLVFDTEEQLVHAMKVRQGELQDATVA